MPSGPLLSTLSPCVGAGGGGSVSPRRQRKVLRPKQAPETPSELLKTMNRQVVMEALRAGHEEIGALSFLVSSCLEDIAV